ncbi:MULTISPECIES: ribosomal maturation YjgA family protein [Bizionia]|uniref:DUF2809 domain-containing protein n=1 Tax=Bizionia algoritergicola TaxID=291187 RepID=A0A5D0QVQ7_9FLAO|nr:MULTISPECIES: DUF2809 domain-containing protein [Bizionia]OBX22908.1 hypothetical protein BAA08_06420 [Bizionia sp. APA-3]TYB72781.1 DUF2809 domain-containing protein [Bizionia algoritergicola]
MKLHFNRIYFLGFVILFIIEGLIAYFLKTGFIRHTFGDFLIVILLYCFAKSFINAKPIPVALAVLLFAFIIEFLQLGNLLEHLNQQDNTFAILILGSTFHVSDLIAYTLGIVTVLIFELKLKTL